ncbi:CueP family metal-binding protein [Ornithinimicrobium cryptoxanthini]|uniref:CueP family metal-binding protein n=1 Tax=Ornithinimicrobium cryptoxanthini TaxID=2934161 RepID=UPI00211908BD|nr:CueP family metal-binding protein [Ornithinimicrobium cryptoxanthini]
MRLSAALAASTLALVAVAGCSTEPDETAARDTAAEVAGAESALLAEHGLQGMTATQIVDTLDASTDPRPLALGASVKPGQVMLTDGVEEILLDLPEDKFYVSIAPFVDSTHECYFHSLGTCQGELTQEPVQVKITDAGGDILVDEEVTTGTNGFAGFWLPRDIAGTIEIEHEGRTGSVDFTTDDESPTCITTLQLSA